MRLSGMLLMFGDPLVQLALVIAATASVMLVGTFANAGAQTFLRRDISEWLGKSGAALLLGAVALVFVPAMSGRLVFYLVAGAALLAILAMGAFVSRWEAGATNRAFRFAVMFALALLGVVSLLLLFGVLSWATHFTWLG